MKHIIVQIRIIVSILILLFVVHGYSQEISKDKIYLDFSYYKQTCEHQDLSQHLKIQKKEGIQFNLCGKALFFNPAKHKPNTIDNKYLSNYPFTKLEDVDKLVANWQRKTELILVKEYGSSFLKTTNKNNMFETYLIEKLDNDCFVLYRVYWKHQEMQ
ncbi:MAG: hypothetical protein AAF611_14995 [Bacteroidota bacterium]